MDVIQGRWSLSFRLFLVSSLAVVSIAVGPPATAGDPVKPPKGSDAAQSANVDKAEQFINALVTTNRAPKLHKGQEDVYPVFPADFDWNEYARVRAAIESLDANSEEVWPTIVEHLTDTDYCFTVQFIDSAVNYSRGDVCARIVQTWINGAYWGCMPGGEGQPFRLPAEGAKALQEWCRKRRNKTFVEIEIDAAEWAISTIQDERRVPQESIDRAIDGIRARTSKIRETNKPIRGQFFMRDTIIPYSAEDAARIKKLISEK
jgi:hypothetical protein